MRAMFLMATALLAMTAQAETPAAPTVLELRQYKIFPGQRDAMIDVFESKLIEGQEQVGMRLLGQFREEQRLAWPRVGTTSGTVGADSQAGADATLATALTYICLRNGPWD